MDVELTLPNNGWRPRPHQRRLWNYMERGGKRAMVIAHRRWGKDDVALHYTACALHEKVADYWHCLPQFTQARKAIWTAVNPHTGKRRIDEAFPHHLREQTWENEMAIRFKNGSLWRVVGSDNPDSLVGTAPAGLVMSEYAMSNPASWGYLAPILEENGGWAMFITTPRGRNHAYRTFQMAKESPDWLAVMSSVRESGFPMDRVEKQRAEYHSIFGKDAGDALIEQEYFCSFEAAILGSFWGKLIGELEGEGRYTRVPIEPSLPVHRVWDLGKGQHMAIWFFQVVGGEVRIVDFVQGHAIGIPGFAKIIREEKNIRGGIDHVPHDAKVVELGTEKSRLETMVACGLDPQLIADHRVEDRVNAGVRVLPRCWFNKIPAVEEGLEAMRNYRAEWDQDKMDFSRTPVADWSTHASDAFGYLSYTVEEITVSKPKLLPGTMYIAANGVELPTNQVTMDDLWKLKQHESNPMGYN